MRLTSIVAFGVIAFVCCEARAWNALGHKVVAEIAWRQLEPEQRHKIVDILRRHPRFDADFAAKMTDDALAADKAAQDRWIFQHAAYWPDVARGLKGDDLARYNRPTWHYVTNPLYLDPGDGVLAEKLGITNSAEYPTDTPREEMNVLQAIAHSRAALASGAGAGVKSLAYCWLFHLVGDIHQPLHSTSLFSVIQLPLGDRGGNSIPLAGGANLHSRWDELLGERNLLRDVDREAEELSDLDRYANAWTSPTLKDLEPQKWAAESHDLCKSTVYSNEILNTVRSTPAEAKIEPLRLPDSYFHEAGNIARERVVTAGLRLALLLGADRIEPPVTFPVSSVQATRSGSLATPTYPASETQGYWLNSGSNVRHNRSCKWFGNTKRGRYCSADEGKPCGECGG